MKYMLHLMCFALLACFAADASVANAATTGKTNSNDSTSFSEVALEMVSGRITFPVEILDGKPMKVMYDSGAQGAMISQTLATELKLPIVGEMLVGSPSGGTPKPVKLVSLGSLKVGSYMANNAPMSLDAIILEDTIFPPGIQLIIGNNQFPNAQIELDIAKSRFRLSNVITSDSNDWQKLDERGLLAGSLKVGSEIIPIYIDVGNPGIIDFPKSYSDRLPLKSPLLEKTGVSIKMVDRVLQVYSAQLDTEALLAGIPVQLKGQFHFADFPFANVGAQALKNARILIDNRNRRWKIEFYDAGKPRFGS
jgi:Aspartyl protease